MNINEVHEFFKFLNKSENATFTCAYMKEDGGSVLPGFGCFYAQVPDLIESWHRVQGQGMVTLHTTLNQTNLNGRRRENITACRVLCLDIDRDVEEQELRNFIDKLNAQMIVESSPGRFHVYWKLMPVIPIERWSLYQLGLAEQFKGDKNLEHPTSMIRVPGLMRRCKDGSEFMPKILYLASRLHNADGSARGVSELTEKGLLAQFPKIGEWGKAGAEKLAAERKKIGLLARKAWREKGKGRIEALSQMPEAGRNTSLYLAIKDESYRSELSLDEALELGRRLNSSFKEPLGDGEVILVATKAWHKAMAALEARAERSRDAITMLSEIEEVAEVGEAKVQEAKIQEAKVQVADNPEPTIQWMPNSGIHFEVAPPSDVADAIIHASAETGKNGHTQATPRDGEVLRNGAEVLNDIKSALAEPEKELKFSQRGIDPVVAEGIVHGEIPKSIWEAGKLLGTRLWEVNGVEAVERFIAARSIKQYNLFAGYLCSHWDLIGVFRTNGPIVFLEGLSRWKSKVRFGCKIDKEIFQSVMSHAIIELTSIAKVRGSKALNKKLKDVPTQTQLSAIEKVIWPIACSFKAIARQENSLIVFQNGVLNLDTFEFSEDSYAPLKYSHPVWCRFVPEVGVRYFRAAQVEGRAAKEIVEEGEGDAQVEGKAITGRAAALRQDLPVFSKYMEDWFPGDEAIVTSLLRYFGYGLTTDYRRQAFSFFYGPTRAGKGSICRTMCALVGDQNYASADYSVLDGVFRTAELHDKLLITIEEAEGTPKEHEKRMGYLKKLLGGERVCFERKYGQPFEDELIGKIIFQANEPPVYQDKGHAIRSRMLCVGFERSFELAEKWVDPAEKILESEADKLGTVMALEWAIGRVYTKPFAIEGSHALEVGNTEVGDAIDLIGAFLRRYIEVNEDGCVGSKLLAMAITVYCAVKKIQAPLNMERTIKNEVIANYVKSFPSNLLKINGKRYRGYSGIELSWHRYFPDMQSEIELDDTETMVRLNELEQLVRG